MQNSLLRTNEELMLIYNRNVNVIYKICYVYMKNPFDAENIVQDTFIKLISSDTQFESAEHEKAWLIRTSINLCKNSLKHWWRRNTDIEDEKSNNLIYEQTFQNDDVLNKILALPEKYKTAIYLYYYEEYSTKEISEMLGINESTIRGHLRTGRNLLKMEMESDLL